MAMHVLLVDGPDRGKIARMTHLDEATETCRVWFGKGMDKRSYRISIDAVARARGDEAAELAGDDD